MDATRTLPSVEADAAVLRGVGKLLPGFVPRAPCGFSYPYDSPRGAAALLSTAPPAASATPSASTTRLPPAVLAVVHAARAMGASLRLNGLQARQASAAAAASAVRCLAAAAFSAHSTATTTQPSSAVNQHSSTSRQLQAALLLATHCGKEVSVLACCVSTLLLVVAVCLCRYCAR